MITNFDLEKLARFYKLPLAAISMKNELPTKSKEGCYIYAVINGWEWVSFKNICYYFDSFGAPPPVEIINFIKKEKGSHLLFNNYIIQNIKKVTVDIFRWHSCCICMRIDKKVI